MKTEAYFIEHCDNPTCDLGYFQYTCPCCGHIINDYDIWWKQDECYYGEIITFQCENCNANLKVEWNKDEYLFYVSEIITMPE